MTQLNLIVNFNVKPLEKNIWIPFKGAEIDR